MKKNIGIWMLSAFLAFNIMGCSTTATVDANTQAAMNEVSEELDVLFDYSEAGNFEGVRSMLNGTLATEYAPTCFYDYMTTQFPDFDSCRDGALEVAKYIMSRQYQNPVVEQIDISQDGSAARVLVSWTGIDTSDIDTTSLKDNINDIIQSVYEQNKLSYDETEALYGTDEVNKQIQEDSFPEIFSMIQSLYENASDTSLRGIFCFGYSTSANNWELQGIVEYMDLYYTDKGTYNWNYEQALDDFESGKKSVTQENLS